MKMVCITCKAHEEKLRLMPGANLTFVTESTNYHPSTLKDREQTEGHKRAEKGTEHKKAKATGSELPPKKVSQDPHTTDSTIAQELHKMGENEHKALVKFHHIAYQIALKGLPFTHFKDETELQKLYDVKFKSGVYENKNACCNFIVSISDFPMNKNIEDLQKGNFFALLCDGSTDHSITEQEVVYVAYCNPKTFEPCLKYFHLASPKDSQDALGHM